MPRPFPNAHCTSMSCTRDIPISRQAARTSRRTTYAKRHPSLLSLSPPTQNRRDPASLGCWVPVFGGVRHAHPPHHIPPSQHTSPHFSFDRPIRPRAPFFRLARQGTQGSSASSARPPLAFAFAFAEKLQAAPWRQGRVRCFNADDRLGRSSVLVGRAGARARLSLGHTETPAMRTHCAISR